MVITTGSGIYIAKLWFFQLESISVLIFMSAIVGIQCQQNYSNDTYILIQDSLSFFYLVQHNYWMYFGLLSRVYLLCLTTYPKYTASTLQERYRNNKKGLPLYFSFSFLNHHSLVIILCLNTNQSDSKYFHNSKIHVLMLSDYYYQRAI